MVVDVEPVVQGVGSLSIQLALAAGTYSKHSGDRYTGAARRHTCHQRIRGVTRGRPIASDARRSPRRWRNKRDKSDTQRVDGDDRSRTWGQPEGSATRGLRMVEDLQAARHQSAVGTGAVQDCATTPP